MKQVALIFLGFGVGFLFAAIYINPPLTKTAGEVALFVCLIAWVLLFIDVITGEE